MQNIFERAQQKRSERLEDLRKQFTSALLDEYVMSMKYALDLEDERRRFASDLKRAKTIEATRIA